MMVAVAKIIIIIIVTINITTTTTITIMIIMISSRHDRMICKMLVSDKWWWRREKTGTNIRWGLDKTLISWSSTFLYPDHRHLKSWSSTFYILIIDILYPDHQHCHPLYQPGWHKLCRILQSWLGPEFYPQSAYIKILRQNCRQPSFLREKWHSWN